MIQEWSFWDSNLFQSLTLIVTVALTWFIYHQNRREKIKNASTMLLLQIKNIEINIDQIKKCIFNSVINIQNMHYSKIVFDENLWTQYNYMFANTLDRNSFECLNKFFITANEIKSQQTHIKNKIIQSLDYKTMHYYNAAYEKLNNGVREIEKPEFDNNKTKLLLATTGSLMKIVDLCYNNENTLVNIYIPAEFGNGLIQALQDYESISGTVAFSKLTKLSTRKWYQI